MSYFNGPYYSEVLRSLKNSISETETSMGWNNLYTKSKLILWILHAFKN